MVEVHGLDGRRLGVLGEAKNNRKAEDGELYISKVFVAEGVTMKRMRPAPQGRGYRIRKRSNHVTLFVDAKTNDEK